MPENGFGSQVSQRQRHWGRKQVNRRGRKSIPKEAWCCEWNAGDLIACFEWDSQIVYEVMNDEAKELRRCHQVHWTIVAGA